MASGWYFLPVKDNPQAHACNCIGPQNGQPRCPCLMRNVTVVGGRYQLVQDLGPVVPPLDTERL